MGQLGISALLSLKSAYLFPAEGEKKGRGAAPSLGDSHRPASSSDLLAQTMHVIPILCKKKTFY